jgi:hypothetical protein
MILVLAGSIAGCVEREVSSPPAPSPAPVSVPPEPARAALTLDAEKPYALFSPMVGACVQFAGRTASDHARALLAPCDGSKAQQFKVAPVAGGYQTFINAESSKCLDVEAVSMAEAAHVQQFGCNGGLNQQWILADGRPGTLRLIARHSGKALDIEGATAANGSPINQFTWHSGENQQFKLLDPSAAVEAAAQVARAKAGAPVGEGGSPGTPGAIKPGAASAEKGSEAHRTASKSKPAKAKSKTKSAPTAASPSEK